MTFSISILVTLTVFYLVLIELIPPTSLVREISDLFSSEISTSF